MTKNVTTQIVLVTTAIAVTIVLVAIVGSMGLLID
jgi:hypothetical protein